MPLSWKLVTFASALAFLASGLCVRRRPAPWLSAYFFACVPACAIWGSELWMVSRWLRPFVLALQALAVIEAVCLLHEHCWNPRRRYYCAAFCALFAIADTFWAVEYPEYPKALWWAQLWLEVGSSAACVAALGLFRYWSDFRPAGWTIGNVAIMGIYCWVEAAAMLWNVTAETWVSVDITLALVQGWCLFAWCVLYRRNL